MVGRPKTWGIKKGSEVVRKKPEQKRKSGREKKFGETGQSSKEPGLAAKFADKVS